jgi:uncharacterized protein (TIGR02246 family)
MQCLSLLGGPIFPIVGCILLLPPLGVIVDDQSQADAEVRKLLDAGVKAYNDHDAKAWSMIFHHDAEYTNVIGWTLHGRDDIETYFGHLFAKERHPKLPSFQNAVVKPDGEPSIRFRRPGVAIVRFRWTITGGIGTDNKEMPKREMLMSTVITKENGVWGIASYHNMDRRLEQPKEIPPEILQKP